MGGVVASFSTPYPFSVSSTILQNGKRRKGKKESSVAVRAPDITAPESSIIIINRGTIRGNN
jgi:hypothetical protein